MSTITLKLNEEQQDKLYAAFQEAKTQPPAYARYQLRPEGCVITCYNSGKTVFQGKDAEVYASAFQTVSPEDMILPQAGSDEVGTGDYFGPVCVAAVIIHESDLPNIQQLGIGDSKQISDVKIRQIAPKLEELLVTTRLIVTPEKYNQVHAFANMNAIKAKLHNQAYINLSAKEPLPDFCMVDQFAEKPIYYHYLKNEPKVIRSLHFETKAEDRYLSVGAASIIARNAFLTYMDQMSAAYDMTFARGSGAAAEKCAETFVKRYGKNRLREVSKLHFALTERI